jgi:acetoin utilization deacetylase AcuC-like enzyme
MLFTLNFLLFLLPCCSFFVPFVNKQPVALYASDVCVGHQPGNLLFSHPESPARLRELLNALEYEWVPEIGREWLQVRDPEGADVTDEQLLRVHSRAHLAIASSAFLGSKALLQVPTLTCSQTIANGQSEAAAKRAAGLVIAAVDDLFGSGNKQDSSMPQRAFVMARPPGHHAESNKPMGFCFYNNVLVGAAHAQAVHGLERIAILDFDVHHGNGDAEIASSNPAFLYVSSHETGKMEETGGDYYPGTGKTAGRTGRYQNLVDAPLPAGADSREFRRAWSKELLPAVREFNPEAIFLSAGFDAHKNDAYSSIQLDEDDFKWLTQEIVSLGKPIISVLEGGYNVPVLKTSVRAHLEGLIS